ncbi:TlyA family RNA methyltransferase [bacterium]|nr:MAG: TlyA family RNA methyltransferase [bacterium]QQR61729.1 MAG: TlyA family RNA methyltransferase [bacterium]QQR62703.1 MAG: TlyA family RNA methyltransferase [bacterium]
MEKKKVRADLLVQQKYPHLTRCQIQQQIAAATVFINNQVVKKPGHLYDTESEVLLTVEHPKYVSRAGFKLEAALNAWSIDVSGLVCLDAGISTGGFTDCLLQKGACKVYGIDVGHGQTHEKIAQDARVYLFEKINLRYGVVLPEPVDLITLDLSFISVLKVIPAVLPLLKPASLLIVLIKPQFELDVDCLDRAGVVRSENDRQKAVQKVIAGCAEHGFILKQLIPSPMLGGDGNQEFLGLFSIGKTTSP